MSPTTSLDDRLADAFLAVFPARSREEIPFATRGDWPEWDSLAAITLLTVLQQEFDAGIELTDMEQLESFEAARHYLKTRTHGG